MGENNRRTLELTIESAELKNWLLHLDKRNVAEATKRCPEWFKKEIDPKVLEAMYVNIARPPSIADGKWTVKVKVKCRDKYPTNIFIVRENKEVLKYEPGSIDDLQKGAKCLVIAETAGLWFMKSQFGMSLV